MALKPYKAVFRQLFRSMMSEIGPPHSVLEAGCAEGKMLTDFLGAAYTGTSFSESELESARRSHPSARFFFADLGEPGSLPSEQFDLVVCTHTISYVPKPRFSVAVNNLIGAIADSGHLVIQFTQDDASVLLPILEQDLVTLRHRRYGGQLLELASRAGLRLSASERSGWRTFLLRLLNVFDFGREHHVMLLKRRSAAAE